MSYKFKNFTINKLTVIGAGQIGPDIALHFAKAFAKNDVKIILVDVIDQALVNAQKRIEKKIAKGVDTGAFKPAMAKAMKSSIIYTRDYRKVKGSDIVMEAATEDEKIKHAIFAKVEKVTNDKCMFFSNSSHMQPEAIFKNVKNKKRCLVVHYFFPAERNPIVEIVPSYLNGKTMVEDLLHFYEAIGKIPIKVKSSFGFAVDPIFEGLCQAAIMFYEQGLGTVKEIDKVAQETLGLGVGPFTALNLTGGNPITNHGLDEMGNKLMMWFRSPKALQEAVANNTPWQTAKRDEKVTVDDKKRKVLEREFLGVYFSLAGFILDRHIVDLNDLSLACEVALVMKSPFKLMNQIGVKRSLKIVKKFCAQHKRFKIPKCIKEAANKGKWEIANIIRENRRNIAILTIRRPQALNALNSGMMVELKEHFKNIENDQHFIGTVLTGYGTKAFVAGADIKELATCKTPEEGYKMSKKFHSTLNYIEKMKKPVVCAYNGYALGGGNELAMACTTRICRKGMHVLASQPEVHLGFIAGSGGTQRLPRLVGLDIGAEILRTGRIVSSSEAAKIGLVHKEVEGDLIDEATLLIKKLYSGTINPRKASEAYITDIARVPDLDIGHLSKKIDKILVKTIYEGAKMDIYAGLDLEAKAFGECIKTKDMKIGIDNFMKNGTKAKAKFIDK